MSITMTKEGGGLYELRSHRRGRTGGVRSVEVGVGDSEKRVQGKRVQGKRGDGSLGEG